MGVVSSDEASSALGDVVKPVQKAIRKVALDLEGFFDDDLAESVLGLTVGDAVSSSSLVLKSLYEFDLESDDGVDRLLELLPILDPEIVKTVMQEIWPGYPVDSLTFEPNLARAEIRGYLLDYLEGHGDDEIGEDPAGP